MVQNDLSWVFCLPFWCIQFPCLCAGVEVWEGESVVLPCHGLGNSSTASVYWCKVSPTDCKGILTAKPGNKNIYQPWQNAGVDLVNSTLLKIPSVSYSRDDGLFRCFIISTVNTMDVSLSVLKPVQSVNLTGPHNPVSENTMTSFICLANSGHPSPVFNWYIDDNPIRGSPDFSQSFPTSRVTLTITKMLNNKTIKCEASVREKSVFEKTTIHVAYKPTVTIVNRQTGHSEGDDFDLICLAEANPPADVTWSFKTKTVYYNNVYRITSFDQSQTGMYECSATNREGTETETIVLTLKDSVTPSDLKILLFTATGLGGLGVLGFLVVCIRLACRNGATTHPESSQVENKSDEPYDDAIELNILPELPPNEPEGEVFSENSLRQGSVRENRDGDTFEVSTTSESGHYEKIEQLNDERYSNPYSRRAISFTREGGPYDIIGGWAGKRRIYSMKELAVRDEDEFSRDLSPRRQTY